jgi:hypothetical protein
VVKPPPRVPQTQGSSKIEVAAGWASSRTQTAAENIARHAQGCWEEVRQRKARCRKSKALLELFLRCWEVRRSTRMEFSCSSTLTAVVYSSIYSWTA